MGLHQGAGARRGFSNPAGTRTGRAGDVSFPGRFGGSFAPLHRAATRHGFRLGRIVVYDFSTNGIRCAMILAQALEAGPSTKNVSFAPRTQKSGAAGLQNGEVLGKITGRVLMALALKAGVFKSPASTGQPVRLQTARWKALRKLRPGAAAMFSRKSFPTSPTLLQVSANDGTGTCTPP